jgi:hypothetical protein
MGREEPGESHPIINEWGGAWVVSSQMRMVPEPKHGQSEIQYFSESQIFINFSLPHKDTLPGLIQSQESSRSLLEVGKAVMSLEATVFPWSKLSLPAE